MTKELWFADLTQCEPSDAISSDGRNGTWSSVDYEIQISPSIIKSGKMIFGLPGSDAPPLKLRLDAQGWHEIRLGIFYGSGAGNVVDRVLRAKLSGDGSYSRFYREGYSRKDGAYPEKELEWWEVAEVFWRCANLSDQDIMISRPLAGEELDEESNLAYVRIVPMDEKALAEWKEELPSAETKLLIANYDGGNLRRRGITSKEGFVEEFSCLRESDFGIALHAAARGPITLYPSKVGEFVRPRGFHGGGHYLHECVEKGLDPLREMIEAAHASGVRLFPQNRLVGAHIPPRHFREDYGGALMLDRPDWLCAYPSGDRLRHLSLAFPGVRDFHVRLMREWIEDYHADGVNVIFSRSFPFVYYEEPVCKAFETEYGEDMRGLPPEDTRVQRTRASFVTQFLREVRQMLDDVGGRQGRTAESCYLVPVNNSPPNITQVGRDYALAECLFNALDVPAWIQEELVDYLIVHLHAFERHDGKKFQSKIREFTDLTRGSRTKVIVDIYPRRMTPEQYRRIAVNYNAAGAQGLSFWDFQNRYPRASELAFMKRLGHTRHLSTWEGRTKCYFRRLPLSRLDGFTIQGEFACPLDG